VGIEGYEVRSRGAGELAREAVSRGATTLGVAGGDGSLAAVAAVALERDLPFVCVPFGTRNHFARDLGLATDDPLGALDAFFGGERRVDVGTVNDRLFVNNVSLGLYASLVHDPRRNTKNRLVALLRLVPAALGRSRRPLDVSVDRDGARDRRLALVLFVGNNDYELTTLADLGERSRLDEGLLHAYVLDAVDRRRLVALLARAAAGHLAGATGWAEWSAPRFRVDSTHPRIHAAIDGEPVVLAPPLEFDIKPRALRVLVPRSGDGEEAGAAAS
jgi:diacylglycerol kinase family enzyme